MSNGLYSHTTRAVATILTAAIYNADHNNHITNANPSMFGAYSDNVAQMQQMRDPGAVGTESLAANLADEIESLRFAIHRLAGGAQWYDIPAASFGSLTDDIDAVSDDIDATVRPALVPVGGMLDWPGADANIPDGWVLMYGQTVGEEGSGATLAGEEYEPLYNILKTIAPNTGAEVFANAQTVVIPDLRGRVTVGQDDMGGVSANRLTGLTGGINGDVLGGAGGAESHILLAAEGPAHEHFIATNEVQGDGAPNLSATGIMSREAASGMAERAYRLKNGDTGVAATVGLTSSVGEDEAHNNVQPSLVVNKIIFTGVFA